MIILIDAMEQHPWTFQGIRADADRGYKILEVQTRREALGPGWGDYSLDGYRSACHIERKSAEDAHGTILGWGERRERFMRELENLATVECAAVVVECSLQHLVATAPSRGKKSAGENAKILFRQVLAWQQDYRVPWVFCEGRRMAEIAAYRILERYWLRQRHRIKQQEDERQMQRQLSLFTGESESESKTEMERTLQEL